MRSDEVETAWLLLANARGRVRVLLAAREGGCDPAPGEVAALAEVAAALDRVEEQLRDRARETGARLVARDRAGKAERGAEPRLVASEARAFLAGLHALLAPHGRAFERPLRAAVIALDDLRERRLGGVFAVSRQVRAGETLAHRRVAVELELPSSDLELLEMLENIDCLIEERERSGLPRPALLDLLRSLRPALEAIVWWRDEPRRFLGPAADDR